jgi:lysophospholipase L1-like esterase
VRNRVLACVVLTVVVLTGCASSKPRVAVVGDSITVLAGGAITQDLRGRYDPDIQAELGQRIDQMLPALAGQLRHHPRAVVVNLGTNDMLQAQVHPDWQTGFVRLVAMVASSPCVVFVTVSSLGRSPVSTPAVADDIDAAIARAVVDHHNFHVVDWNALVHAGNGMSLLLPDKVHPSAEGSRRLAGAIRDVLEHRCD